MQTLEWSIIWDIWNYLQKLCLLMSGLIKIGKNLNFNDFEKPYHFQLNGGYKN